MIYTISTLTLFILLLSCGKTPSEQIVVATIGDRVVYDAELRDRLSFSPIPAHLSQARHKSLVLNAIIAEALFAHYANGKRTESILNAINQKHKEAVIEKLWEDIIFKEIAITDSSLWQFYLKTAKVRAFEFAVFNKASSAESFKEQWHRGNPEVVSLLSQDTIQFTGAAALLENSIFKSQIESIAPIIAVNGRYIVHKVTKEWSVKSQSRQDFVAKRNSIRKQYLKTQKQVYLKKYADTILSNDNYNLNQTLFKALAREMDEKVMQPDKLTGKQPELHNFSDGIKNNAEEIVTFNSGQNWTVAELIKQLAFAPYPLNTESHDAFRYSLMRATKRVLDDELLYRQGLKNELDKTFYVEWQTRMWADYIRAVNISSKIGNKQRVASILDSLSRITDIDINYSVIDTMRTEHTNMVVLKTHFPGQTIVPGQIDWNFKYTEK